MNKEEFYKRLKLLELDLNLFSKLINISLDTIDTWDDELNPIPTKVVIWLIDFEYKIKIKTLQKEFIKIYKTKKWDFEAHHQAMYDFVIHKKRFIEFKISDYEIVVKIGNKDLGFKHFILRHYGIGSDGEIKALDILKVGNVIKNEIIIPSKGKDKMTFIQIKNDTKYTVILKKDKSGKLLFNFFSNK